MDWISRERFPQFVKVTRGRFSKLMSTKKLLVMAVLQENKIGQLSQQTEMESFRQMLKAVLEANIDKYRPHFQFGWTGNPDLANSVAMQVGNFFYIYCCKQSPVCPDFSISEP